MRQAIDASLAFTDALGRVQGLLIERLDEISGLIAAERSKVSEREAEMVRFIQEKSEFSRMALGQLLNDVSALRAVVSEGNDDMVMAMASLFRPRKTVEPLGPADAETVALAVKLAPRAAAE